jgi:hypothetical protein
VSENEDCLRCYALAMHPCLRCTARLRGRRPRPNMRGLPLLPLQIVPLLLLPRLLLGAGNTAGVQWWVEAASTNVFEDDLPPPTSGQPSTSLNSSLDIHMMLGEVEHRQIVVRLGTEEPHPLRNVSIRFVHTTPPPAGSRLGWRQQGFVKCAQFFYETMRPVAVNGSMFPDILWGPTDGDVVLWPGVTASFWVDVEVLASSSAGQFSGSVELTADGGKIRLVSVPFYVEVWDVVLPSLAVGRFTAVMSWIDSGDFTSARRVGTLIDQGGGKDRYWQWMCDYRMPPNKLYVAPAFNFHRAANGSGAHELQLLTNKTVGGQVQDSCGRRGGAGWISIGNVELLAGHRLPNYTAAQIDSALAAVAPTMAAAERLGVADRVFACACLPSLPIPDTPRLQSTTN